MGKQPAPCAAHVSAHAHEGGSLTRQQRLMARWRTRACCPRLRSPISADLFHLLAAAACDRRVGADELWAFTIGGRARVRARGRDRMRTVGHGESRDCSLQI